MTASPAQNTWFRAAGAIVFIAAFTAALATFLFPIMAGLFRVGMPATPAFQAIAAWSKFVLSDGHYTAFWQTTWWALWAGNRQAFITASGKAVLSTAGIALLGAMALVIVALLSSTGAARKGRSEVKRRLLRGGHVLTWPELPEASARLIADDLAPDGERRRIARTLHRLRPDRSTLQAARADAKALQWPRRDIAAIARSSAMAAWAARHGMVRLGTMPMPRALENSHLLVCASTGAGKTLALKQLLGDLRRRGDRVIVLDAGYDLSGSYRETGDLVLSPLDPDSEGWDLRNEIRAPSEWARMVASVVPATGSGDAVEWKRKAQSFLTNICIQVGEAADNRKLLDIASVWSTEALRSLLTGTPSGTLLEEGGERYLNSVKSNVSEAISTWQFGKSGPFSLRSYMTSDDPRWLWLPYRDVDKSTVAPAIATWIDILVLAGLERAGMASRCKTWIIIDELDSIGAIGGLKEAVTRLRKSDVAIVAAIQDYSQLVERYGSETAKTLFGSFSNRLYLRCNSEELATKISKELGQAEYEETRTSTSQGATRSAPRHQRGSSSTVSTSATYVKSELVLPSEIQNLKTRTGLVSFSGDATVYPVIIPVPA